jgi:hypothetical protein
MATRRKRTQPRTRRRRYDFKPDSRGASFLKQLHLTQVQQRHLLRWSLFAALCIGALVLQDVIMSRFSLLGATTDLVPGVILLICVAIGSEQGSLFALIASSIYFFSGSAPGPYAIAYLSFLSIGGALIRENFWRRGFSSDVLCAGVALVIYELTVFSTGIFLGLTTWYRFGVFLLTAILSVLVMLPLYRPISAIDRIGGETWKE